MKAEIVRCQGCGATLPFDGTQSVIVCEYCGTRNTITIGGTDDVRTRLLRRGQRYMEQGRFLEARKCYLDILEDYPYDSDVWYYILEAQTWKFTRRDYPDEPDCRILHRFVYNMAQNNKYNDARLDKTLGYLEELKEMFQKETDYRESIGDDSKRGDGTGVEAMSSGRLAWAVWYCTESILIIGDAKNER